MVRNKSMQLINEKATRTLTQVSHTISTLEVISHSASLLRYIANRTRSRYRERYTFDFQCLHDSLHEITTSAATPYLNGED